MAIYKITFNDKFEPPFFNEVEFENLKRLKGFYDKNKDIPNNSLRHRWPFAYYTRLIFFLTLLYHTSWSVLELNFPETEIPFIGIYAFSVGWYGAIGQYQEDSIKSREQQRKSYYKKLLIVCGDLSEFESTKKIVGGFNQYYNSKKV